MECERERRNVENAKNRIHEELISNMARRNASKEFELERERKIREMKMLTESMNEEGLAMAETNEKLQSVHTDLKNAFKRMEVRVKSGAVDKNDTGLSFERHCVLCRWESETLKIFLPVLRFRFPPIRETRTPI